MAVTGLEQGYREMYNLQFPEAHRLFQEWERTHPNDPLGPVSDGAAYLFAEFDRLRILQSEFFTDDEGFFKKQRNLQPDANAKRNFEAALARSEQLANAVLAKNPSDEDAGFATLLRIGLRSDYLAFIEKRNIAALSEVKQSRTIAENLLKQHPGCADCYIAVGLENYMLSLKPMPVRWLLRLGGAQTDKQTGIERLRITAEKGHYLRPFAKLLLGIAALRDKDVTTARRLLGELSVEFPKNQLYREELSKLK